MAEMSRQEFIGHMHAYADSIEQDMTSIKQLQEDGVITEGEANEILARLAGEHETITEMISEFRKHL